VHRPTGGRRADAVVKKQKLKSKTSIAEKWPCSIATLIGLRWLKSGGKLNSSSILLTGSGEEIYRGD
jgi:hypothetical protein